jgi:hypothetical protein
VQEWLRIRDELVRPLLATAPGAEAGAKAARSQRATLRCDLAAAGRYGAGLPLLFLLGWIAVESGGNNGVVTPQVYLQERGFVQISKDESAGRKFDHLRITAHPDDSVQAGVQLVRYYADLAWKRSPWIPDGSEFFWPVV